MIKALVLSLAVLHYSCIYLEKREVSAHDGKGKQLITNLEYFAPSDAENDFHAVEENNARFFIVNFEGYDVKILKLALIGHGVKNQFISKFKLEASFDGKNFYPVNGGRAYEGNNDYHRKIETYFYNGLPAKYLKFIPLEFCGDISFRIQITYTYLAVSDVFDKEKVVTKSDGFQYSQISLWERIGGHINLVPAVNEALTILLANPIFGARLDKKYLGYMKDNLLEFFQVLLGGSRECGRHDCATNLNAFGVQEANFDIFVKILVLGFKNATTLDTKTVELILKQIYFNKSNIVCSY